MKLYLVAKDYNDYDHYPIPLGVFSSIELAHKACQDGIAQPITWETELEGYSYFEAMQETVTPIPNPDNPQYAAFVVINEPKIIKTNLFSIQEIELDKRIE